MLTAVVAIYLLATLIVGVVFNARIKKVADYLVAGRNLGLVLTTASLAAVQIGAGIVLGGAENGAAMGIWPGVWYGIGCAGGLILGGLLAAGRLRALGGYVPMDYFAMRYGERRWVRLFAWASNAPSLLGILAAQLMASGSVLAGFGFDFTTAVIVLSAVILISNVMSGMWGVVAVDFIQVAIIVVGIPIAAVAALSHPQAAPLGTLLATPFIPEGQGSKAIFLITPFLFSIPISYDAFIRYQSAKSASVAKWACILAGLLVLVASFGAALIGAAGRQIVPPDVANRLVLPGVISSTLPPVLGGIVLAALLAAAMSTANALLISLSGSFSRDFYNKFLNPTRELDDLPHAMRNARIALAVALVIGVVAALNARSILGTIILFSYPYMASMMVPLFGGLLWRGATARGALAAMAVGGAIGVAAFFSGAPGPLNGWVNVDLGLLIAFAASAVAFVVVSLTDPGRKTIGVEPAQ